MKRNRKPTPFHVVPGDPEGTTWVLPDGAIARFGKGEHKTPGGDVKLSPDGTYFATATSIGLWWYDVSTLSPIALWETERGGINAIDFSPDGKHISIANWDGVLKVMDVQSGRTISEIKKKDRYVRIVFSPDGNKWGVADHRGIIQVLDAKTGQCLVQMDRGQHEQSNDVSQLEFSPNGHYIAGSVENPELYSVNKNKIINPDTEGTQTYIWSPETGMPLIRFAGRNFAFSPDSRLMACATPDEAADDVDSVPSFISVYDVAKGERIAYFTEHRSWVHTVTFSPCGQFLASCDVGKILCLWDLPKGALRKSYVDCGTPFYTQDGRLLTVMSRRESIEVWNVEHREKLQTIARRFGSIGHKWFSKCPQLAVAHALSDKPIKSTTQTFPILREPTLFPDYALAFSPCGRYFASGTWWQEGMEKMAIKLWEVASGENIATFWGHPTDIQSLAFSTDSKLLASGGFDRTILLWDLKPFIDS